MGLKVFTEGVSLETEVKGGYASDLLSDVMGHAEASFIWVTLQTHKNIMAVASLKELSAIILVKGFEPDADTLQLALQEGIPILGTQSETFDTCGKLYSLLHK